jgi:hypothetical protein
LFAGPRYGGICIPEYYTELGYGHLQYFIGHLKLGDDVGQLILSLITQTQLQVGSTTQCFQLSYSTYAKWIDSTWITDVWKYTNRVGITIELEKPWLPPLLRDGDIALMDLALTFDLDMHQLRCINYCRIYFQVITVGDIVTARGDQLIQTALLGEKDWQRVSTLQWPDIPRPPSTFWNIWLLFLQYFCRGNKLHTPLGHWVATPHYQWQWFRDSDGVVWEYDCTLQQWYQHTAAVRSC